MNLLDGDLVLFAGGTGRVGGATLKTLIREGARVVVLSRSKERAQVTIDAELAAGERGRASAQVCDLARCAADAAAAAVDFAVRTFGRIDALVSLAGTGVGRTPLVESSLTDLRANLDAFVVTAYNLAVPALRAMLAQPFRDGARSRGRIVTVTAGSSKAPAPGRGLFGVAKAGVNVLMQAIAREHKADGIVANALVLGGVGFAGAEEFYSPEDFAAAAALQGEVADALAMLASDCGSGINGALR